VGTVLRQAALLLGLLCALGCVRKTADYCASDGQCESMRCNHRFMRCEPVGGTLEPDGNPHLSDGGGASGSDGKDAGGTDAGGADGRDTRADTTPTCSPACVAPKPVCETPGLTCVGCLAPTDCAADPTKPICDTRAKTCVECLASTDCTGDPSKPVCDTTNTCVPCLASSDCKGTAAPICDTAAKTCGKCTADAQCAAKDPARPACDTISGACFPCVDGKKHCPAAAPICDANACRVCTKDVECAVTYGADPGLCLDGSGQCGTSAQTIYLQNGTSCSTTARGDGSAGSPFCFPADAAAALSTQKSILVVRGPRAIDTLNIGYSASAVVVAGQAGGNFYGATVTGTPPLIATTGGDVTLRDLTISGGPGPGISATGGTLRLLRCLVESNAGPGIQTTSGTAFDIENTVIAKNGGTTRAGAELGATTSTPTLFRNNTVLGNGAVGVQCGAGYNITSSIVFGNNAGTQQLSPLCVASDACATACSAVNPMLDETAGKYQLTVASPAACIDALDTAPPTDRKGTPRPQGPKSDCGADEFVP
jgi:hypothetical protein